MQMEVEDQQREAEMIDLNDLQSSVAPASSLQPHQHHYNDDSGSDRETVLMSNGQGTKPVWLEHAENKVKQHLGPGRSSHDFAHADRIRRQAMSLAKSQIRKHRNADLKVVELSSLFISAANDPKHPIEDPKTFVKEFFEEQQTCIDQTQFELIVKITRATGIKKEERRRKEHRETEWHKTCVELHWCVLCLRESSSITEDQELQCARC